MSPDCRQSFDLDQMIWQANGGGVVRGTRLMDPIPTSIASVTKVLGHSKSGVEITQASRANRRLGIVTLLGYNSMETESM